MVTKECERCRWRGTFPGVDHITCDYAWITGKCRTAMERRADGICPAFEGGDPVRIEVRPMDDPFRAIIVKGKKFSHEELLELYQKGMTDGEIAREIGSVKSTIYKWRHRNELPPNGKPPSGSCSPSGRSPPAPNMPPIRPPPMPPNWLVSAVICSPLT